MINKILGVYFSSDNFRREYDQIRENATKEAYNKHSEALDKLYEMKINKESDIADLKKQFNIVDDTITEACNSVADALYEKGFSDAIAITGFKGIDKETIKLIIENEQNIRWEETCENMRLHVINR